MSGFSGFPPANSRESVPLVVGLGNQMAADDSVGIELVRMLRNQRELECDLLELSQPGLNLLDLCERRGWILFVDGVCSGLAPGTIHLIPLPTADVESQHIGTLSSHSFGLPEVLELCRVLARPMPALMLLGIEIGTVKYGEARSGAVERAMQSVVSGFPSLLRLLNTSASPLWRETHRYAGDARFPEGAEMGQESEQSARTA